MSYPEHFYADTATHRILPYRWHDLSGNPRPKALQYTPLPLSPFLIRLSAKQFHGIYLDTWHSPLEAVNECSKSLFSYVRGSSNTSKSSCFHEHGVVAYTPREAELFMRLMFNPTPLQSVEDFDVRFDACIEATKDGPTLTREQATTLLLSWILEHVASPTNKHPTLQCAGLFLRECFGMICAIEVMLEVSPPALLVQGLKFLASYHLDAIQKSHIDELISAYLTTHDPVGIAVEMELIRLSPTRARVQSVMTRAINTQAPYHERLNDEHRYAALFSVQDPDLFRELLYQKSQPPKHYSPSHFIAHVHHFGTDHLHFLVPLLLSKLNTWSLMQWGVIFKVHAGELTDVMLTAILEETKFKDFKRMANTWLFEGGKQVIARCIVLVQHDEKLHDLALQVLDTYAQLGHRSLITAQLEEVRKDTRRLNVVALEEIDAICARTKEHHTPTHHTLPVEQLPEWLVKWASRGLQPHLPLHLDPARFPTLYLNHGPRLPLGIRAITGMLRYLQKFGFKNPLAPSRVSAMLDDPSRAALSAHLTRIWNVQRQHSSHGWLAMTCAALMSEAQILQICKRINNTTHSIYARQKNWDTEILLASERACAIQALINLRMSAIFQVNPGRYTMPKVVKRLADRFQINVITLLTRHITRDQVVHGGHVYIWHMNGALRASYDESLKPLVVAIEPTQQLSQQEVIDVAKNHLHTTQQELIKLYTEVIPKLIDHNEAILWTYQEWRAAMDHPLIAQLHRAILWQVHLDDAGHVRRARCLEDLMLHDIDDVAVPIEELAGCTISAVETVHLLADERKRWGILLADDEQHLLYQEI